MYGAIAVIPTENMPRGTYLFWYTTGDCKFAMLDKFPEDLWKYNKVHVHPDDYDKIVHKVQEQEV